MNVDGDSDVHHRRIRVKVGQSPKGGFVDAVIQPVHAHSCPYWRLGVRHGPCNCGAHEVWDEFIRQAEDEQGRVAPPSAWALVHRFAADGGALSLGAVVHP